MSEPIHNTTEIREVLKAKLEARRWWWSRCV